MPNLLDNGVAVSSRELAEAFHKTVEDNRHLIEAEIQRIRTDEPERDTLDLGAFVITGIRENG